MTGHERDARLELLLADLFASDERDLELLVRYAEDPEALAPTRRREVEARLDADPSWRDRLRVLQNFDPAALHEEEAGAVAEETAGDEATGSPDAGATVIALPQRNFVRIGAIAATAAAAALAMWLGVGRLETPNPASVSEEIAQQPPAPESIRESASPDDVAIAAAPMNEAGRSEEAPMLAERAVPKTKEEPPILAPQNVAVAQPVDPVGVADLVEVVDVVGVEDVPEEPAFAESLDREPLQLAMLDPVRYVAPIDRAMRGMPGAIVRGEDARVSVEAWVPDHVARCATAQPTLFWELAGKLPENHRLGFTITSETDPEPLYEGTLELPEGQGRQAIELSALDVSLQQGTIYRWTVFVRAPSSDPSEDRIAQGWMQYQMAPGSLAQRTRTGTLAERASVYAESGYWYDALALLVALEDANPDEAKPREILASFLAEAGIDVH